MEQKMEATKKLDLRMLNSETTIFKCKKNPTDY